MVSGSVTKLADGGKAGDAMICFSFFFKSETTEEKFSTFPKKRG